jgi:hypothetical protein
LCAGIVNVETLTNPGSGRTFHPKLYLGWSGSGARAVVEEQLRVKQVA